jgi:hypothetical protein
MEDRVQLLSRCLVREDERGEGGSIQLPRGVQDLGAERGYDRS